MEASREGGREGMSVAPRWQAGGGGEHITSFWAETLNFLLLRLYSGSKVMPFMVRWLERTASFSFKL